MYIVQSLENYNDQMAIKRNYLFILHDIRLKDTKKSRVISSFYLEDGLDEVCEAEPEDDDKSIGSVCIGLSEHLDELVYGGDGM